jgi:hypothetical protein
MHRVIQTIFVVLWASILALPLFFTASQIELVKPVDENRRKAAFPSRETFPTLPELKKWCNDFMRWFEDDFGGRDALIRLKNQVDYSAYDKSDRLHIGRDGFLFYRNLLDQQVAEIERSPPSILDARVDSLEQLGRALSERGITLVIVPIPLKFTVYSEMLPYSAPNLPCDRAFDRFRKALSRQQHLVLFDVLPQMIDLKQKLKVFNKTDFHWSEPAARQVGDALLKKLGQLSGTPDFRSSWSADFALRSFSGGQAMFMPLFVTPNETASFPVKEPPYPTEGKNPPFDWIVQQTIGDQPLLPETVFIGDSFIWALHNTGFTQQFSKFYFSHVLKEDSKKLHRALPSSTRFVILELLETNFLIDYAPL